MNNLLLITIIILTSIIELFGSNNLVYLRKSSINGSRRHLVVANGSNGKILREFDIENATNTNEILFLKHADFNGDGRTDTYYLRKAGGDTRYHAVLDGRDGSLIFQETIDGATSVNEIMFVRVGDFNGDGKKDIYYIRKAGGDTRYARAISIYNHRTLFHGNIPAATSGNEILFVEIGDFNGDGKDDIYYLRKAGGDTRYHRAYSYSTTIFQETIDGANSTNEILFVNAVGPVIKYISYPDDRDFLPLNVTLNGRKIFPIGWWESLDHYPNNGPGPRILDEPDVLYQCNKHHTNSWPNYYWRKIEYLTKYSPTNFTLPYLNEHELNQWISQNITPITQWMTDLQSGTYPKLTIISLKEGKDGHDLPDYNSPKFEKNFSDLVNLYSDFILGWQVGDDTYWEVENGYYSWGELYNLVNYIHSNASSIPYTFATDAWEYNGTELIKTIYENGHAYYDIQMLQEYLFKQNDPPTITIKKKLEFVKKCKNTFNLVKKYNKPGYFYITSGMGHWHITTDTTGNPYRRATWEESRYLIFNSIINGACGITIFSLYNSDKMEIPPITFDGSHVMNNIDMIVGEITIAPSGFPSLESALVNGNIADFKIFSSKDGYSNDSDSYWNYGKDIQDINYIVRKSGSIYFIITSNSSNETVNNVRFYLPYDKVNGKTISEIVTKPSSSGPLQLIRDINVTSYIWHKGDRYSFFEVSYQPFEIKIFRIGNYGVYKKNSSKKIVSNHSSAENFILYQNYPNPFNSKTTIRYVIKKSCHVNIAVYDYSGKLIQVLVDEYQNAGDKKIEWNAETFSSGLYFYRIITDNFTKTKKLLFIK